VVLATTWLEIIVLRYVLAATILGKKLIKTFEWPLGWDSGW
jgi:hypothetical protein